jgi:hypothetical protein
VEQNNQTTAAGDSVDDAAHAGLLDDLLDRAASCFARRETRLTCRDMVHAMLTELDDHNCWTMAEAAGHPGRTGCSTFSRVPASMTGSCHKPLRAGQPDSFAQARILMT